MQLTKEQAERAAACESAAELQAPAKSEGIELTDVQVSDDELDAVSGGKEPAVAESEDPQFVQKIVYPIEQIVKACVGN